ncbi:hypothetical protein FO519_008151 [Halicephalobus sp. NKZ332]|nr:hypothetical protein FO519_008151 [Halicephalobus sp. NKZ332]
MAVIEGAADAGIQEGFRNISLRRKRFVLSKFAVAVSDLESGISSKRLQAVKEIRQILNVHLDWISFLKLEKVISLLKQVLLEKSESEVHENVLWIFCNLSCESRSTCHLIKKGEIKLIQTISEFVSEAFPLSVKDQAVWTLSNFAADCDACRSEVRSTKTLMKICQMLRKTGNEEKRKSVLIWAIRNYVRPIQFEVHSVFENPGEFSFFMDTIVDELKLQTSNENIIEGLNALLGVMDSEPSWEFLLSHVGRIFTDFLVKSPQKESEESKETFYFICLHILERLKQGDKSILKAALELDWSQILLRRLYATMPFISPYPRNISFKIAVICQDIINYIRYRSISYRGV